MNESDLFEALTKRGDLDVQAFTDWTSGKRLRYWAIFGKNEPTNFLAELRGPEAETLAKALIVAAQLYVNEIKWRSVM